MRRVTAHDVALAAGVSKTTVSFVVNDTPGKAISGETRQRVLDVVEQLGYVPNPVAQALRRGQNDLVLFVLPDLPLAPVIGKAIDAMSTGLAERGLSLLVRRLQSGLPVSALWRGLSPAAVVTIGSLSDAEEAEMQAAGIVVGAVLLEDPVEPRLGVVISQQQIGRMQVEHLAAQGCRRVGYAAPLDPRLAGLAGLRIAGASAACAELNLPDLDVRHLALDIEGVMPAVDEWSSTDGVKTGVAAYNDEFGGAVLAALDCLGRRAPTDLAVVGCDNDPLSAFSSPPMTTVDQQTELAGARLAAMTADELGAHGKSSVGEGAVLAMVVRSST